MSVRSTVLSLLALIALVSALAPAAAEAKRPKLDYAWIECQYGDQGDPPCRLAIVANRAVNITFTFNTGKKVITRKLLNQPQAEGDLQELFTLFIWWRWAPPINYGEITHPDRCVKLKLFATNKSGEGRRGEVKICQQGVNTKIKRPSR